QHRRRQHAEIKPHHCNKCDLSFHTKYDLTQHQRSQHETILQCDKCGKCYASKATLRVHAKVHSEMKQQFTCAHCPKSFLYKHYLAKHERTHTGKLTYR